MAKVLKNIAKSIDDDIVRIASKKSAQESAEIFQKATHKGNKVGKVIGDKNPIHVQANGAIDTFFSRNISKGMGADDAVASAIKKNKKIQNDISEKTKEHYYARSNRTYVTANDKKRAENIKDQVRTASEKSKLKGMYPETKAGTKELHDNRRADKVAWMRDKYSKQYMGAMQDLEKGNYDNPILQSYIKNGKKKEEITKDFLSTERLSALKGAKADQMQLRDWMEYNRVPQHAVTAGTTLWLVNKMASGGGQQTNSQLYGQSPY